MAITPAEIDSLTFSPSDNGYDTEEVDAFLEQLTVEVDAMLTKIADLKSRLNSTENQLAAAQAQLENAEMNAPVVEAQPASDFGASERQISQVLIVAQQSADKIVADAREAADHIRNEADQKAREVIRQALAEKQQELDEIDRLKTSREEFRNEYKNLLQHFLDDADTAFPNSVLTAEPRAEKKQTPAPTPQPQSPAETIYAPMPQTQNPVSIDDLD